MAIAQLSPFARLLKQYRSAAELTQEELAERAGLSARAISDLERGVKTRPHRVTVELLADALHLSDVDHAVLLAAVPRGSGLQTDSPAVPPDRAGTGLRLPPTGTNLAHCPPQLRQALEGLVGMYVDENHRDGQITITVVMFSVGERSA